MQMFLANGYIDDTLWHPLWEPSGNRKKPVYSTQTNMCKLTSIFTFLKRLLPILAVAFVLVFPQTSEAKEDWAVTVYGASQLRGDIWSTFYSPDFDTSYYFWPSLSPGRFIPSRNTSIWSLRGKGSSIWVASITGSSTAFLR